MFPFNGSVLQGGLFVLMIVAFAMVVGLQVWHNRSRRFLHESDEPVKASRFVHKVAFEVKLTFFAALLFLYPTMLTGLLASRPTYNYWCGSWLLAIIILVPAWLFLCHGAVSKGWVSHGMSPFVTILLPAAVLAILYQVHWWRFGGQGVALISDDCQSFQGKAELEASWQEAHSLFQTCAENMAKEAGAPLRQEALILQFHKCDGYNEQFAKHGRDWTYLASLEKEYGCGGWCSQHAPLWYAQTLTRDSCSKVAARVMIDGVALTMRQLIAYAGALVLAGILSLFIIPNFPKDW